MQVSTTFKRAFLHLMLHGLNGARSQGTSIQERKKLIKISADAAMAIARGRRAGWSRALLLAGLSEETNKKQCCAAAAESKYYSAILPKSRKILRRSLRSCSRIKSAKKNVAAVPAASVVARRMMKKRTQLLRKLVPGGESLNSLSLLSETVDYVIHLQAQVNLMKCLAKALGASNLKSQMSLEFKKAKVGGLEDGSN